MVPSQSLGLGALSGTGQGTAGDKGEGSSHPTKKKKRPPLTSPLLVHCRQGVGSESIVWEVVMLSQDLLQAGCSHWRQRLWKIK